jgi:hypothetical protein
MLIENKKSGGSGNDPINGGDNSGGGKHLFGGDMGGGGCNLAFGLRNSNFNRKIPEILLLVFSLVLMSCSVKHDAPPTGVTSVKGIVVGLQIDPNADSDGDGIKDADEVALGRNPFVADIPELKLQFMKDFTLSLEGDSGKQLIDSLKDIKSQSYEYNVGDYSINLIAKKTTAKFARFDGVVVGTYNDVDLTRTSYPLISPQFIAKQNFLLGDVGLKNSSVVFTNTLKLERNRGFQSIANPVFNFHYFNYQTGEFELLAQKKIEKVIYEGVQEKIDIGLDDLPATLIKENLLKKGEFITAEIEDYEIPSMGTTYKKLMAKIAQSCIPITIITPTETKVYYVALNANSNHLGQFLKSLYGANFKIENNQLVQIGGLSNNLAAFKLLSELKNQTKEGKWFVLFNNHINDDIFQYVFKKDDRIVLNYMTGDELAQQGFNQTITTLKDKKSETVTQDFEIGEIGQNDEVQIILKANQILIDEIISAGYSWSNTAGSGSWSYRYLSTRPESYTFTAEGIQKRIAFVLNGKEIDLTRLIAEKNATVVFSDSEIKILVKNSAKTFGLEIDDSYLLMLRIYPENHNEDIGVWNTGAGGWKGGQSGCAGADAVCYKGTTGIPIGQVCARIQTDLANECTGVLKDEYRRKSQLLKRDLVFDANFLVINKYN